MFAHTFGATRTLDAYHAAFIVPDLLLNMFVAGALTAAFVPIFMRLNTDNEQPYPFVNTVVTSSLVVMAVGAVFIWLFARPIAHLIAPGFEPTALAQLVILMRILLLSPIIFAISNTLGSINVTRERFFWYGLSAVLYNLGTIGGVFFFGIKYGIVAAAWGTVAGAVLHMLVRLIGNWEFVRNYRPRFFYDLHFKDFLRIMLPKLLVQPIEQYTMLGFTVIASTIGAGTIVVLDFARNFQSMPINLIGATFAMTAFPALSRAAAQFDLFSFKKELSFSTRTILLISIPSALLLFVFRFALIALLLGGGAFDAHAIAVTATTLGWFALSVPTECLSNLYARAFYALKNSVTVVSVTLLSLAISILFGWRLSGSMGAPGLALGFFAGSIIKITLLSLLLRRETRSRFVSGVIELP